MNFSQQYFAVSINVPDNRVLLAGGLHPMSGPRSAYQASVACYDYAAESIVWQFDKVKSYPFRAISHADGVCAAMLPQNFVRCSTGMLRFDLESGEPIQPDSEVCGSKIQFVDALADTFLYSWVCDGTSFVRAVRGRDALVQERSFPYQSTAAGKTIERVIMIGEGAFVAIFSLVEGKRVGYSVEKWNFDSAAPLWEKRTFSTHAVRNNSLLMFWRCTGPKLDVQLLSQTSGEVETSLQLALPDVVSIQPIDLDSYAILTISGAYIMNVASKSVAKLPGMGSSEFLDFGALAVDPALGKLIVVTAGNHQRPGTRVTVLDL